MNVSSQLSAFKTKPKAKRLFCSRPPMSILRSCATSSVTPAFLTCGFRRKFAASKRFPFSPRANLICKNANKSQRKSVLNCNENAFPFHRELAGSEVHEARLWLFVARLCDWPRECRASWRISARFKSHQPFRSVNHFVSRAAKDRLDGDGGIFSKADRWTVSARG